jgi:hypothetical protein
MSLGHSLVHYELKSVNFGMILMKFRSVVNLEYADTLWAAILYPPDWQGEGGCMQNIELEEF